MFKSNCVLRENCANRDSMACVRCSRNNAPHIDYFERDTEVLKSMFSESLKTMSDKEK